MQHMKYILTRMVAGGVPEIEISKEDFFAYKEAQEILSNCLWIEEKYEILISNYLDLEKEILGLTTSRMIRDDQDYSGFFDIRLMLNIRLVNLLTSARLYVDQIFGHVKKCVPYHKDTKNIVKSLLANEYDTNLDYRFMESLRNYVQHQGLAVHWTSMQSRWTSLGKDRLLEYSLEFAVEKELLDMEDGFKKAVLKEIPNQVDLKIAIRRYIESLSKVHVCIRQLIDESVTQARQRIVDAHNQYKTIYRNNFISLGAYQIGDEKIIDKVMLMLEWDNIRVELQKRNVELVNLHKRYATGKSELTETAANHHILDDVELSPTN